MHKYRLRIYRNEPDKIKPLLNTNSPRDKDIDFKIGSIIILDNRNGLRDTKIDKINSKDNSDYENKPRNYSIPKLIEE